MTFRPRRSVLYMPGSNARALDKARTLKADCLILDLEDSVAPEAKEEARRQVAAAVAQGGYGQREIIIRINGPETPWGEDDLVAAAQMAADAVLVPKVSQAGDVARASQRLKRAGAPATLKLWAMMETPAAILNAGDIAAAQGEGPKLEVLVLGTNDLTKETRARLGSGRFAVLPWLATCVAAARAGGLDVIDGVYNDFKDEAGFRTECEQGRNLGMDGKTLIHPAQIEPCNAIFAPSDEDVGWAGKVIGAFAEPQNEGRGVITVDGRMVERLHLAMAERTVEIAKAIAGTE